MSKKAMWAEVLIFLAFIFGFFIANIIVVLAKMQLDEASYQYLDSHSFLSVIFEFVNEFADKPLPDSTTNLPHLYYRPFADIVFYTLVYIKQHFQSNRTIFLSL